MTIARRALFGKLNLTLFRGIESATAFARLRGNPYVELTHWIHQLWQLNDSDLHRMCRHYKVDSQTVEKDLASSLMTLPSGATSLSDFSHHIEAAVERAWVLASLEFGDRSIRGAWLLAALLQTPELRRALLAISPAFQRIPADQLIDEAARLVAGSPEDLQGPHDGSGTAAALPGEPVGVTADSSGGKSALQKYCTDLTARARAGDIDSVIGRSHEIRTMVDILLRRRQNNPLLTGEAGVGKTAVVEGLALAIASGDVPPTLRDACLLSLDVGALLAGASMRGEFESRLKSLLDEAGNSVQPVILFVDEVHTLIGAGGQAGTGDAANLLKPALARGTLRTVGATTWSEYKRHIEKDPALTRRFQTLQISEGDTTADAFAMLRIAGAQPRSTADVLSGLLGESRRSDAASVQTTSSQPSTAVTVPRIPLFDELHDEFVRVVRDPDQLAGLGGWDHPLLAGGGEPAPTLNQLQKQAERFPLLRDILQPSEGIDRIIEGFEALNSSRLLDAHAPEDVLGLFAPELVRDARASLPSLTRREHHELSPDSHVRIGPPRVRSGETKTSDSEGAA